MTHTTAAHRAAALGLLAPHHAHHRKGPVPTVGQRIARARAQARDARPADPDAARARVAAFRPVDAMARPHVALIRELALAAGPADDTDAAELLSALAGHAAWLTATGLDVTADSLVDPDLVQRWALHGLADLAAGTAANYRSRLARVAAAVCGSSRPAPLHASDPCEPYTLGHERAHVLWAGRLPTDRARADLSGAALLGYGCGLPAAELTDTVGDDVEQHDDGLVVVRVRGPRARVVPVRARYGPALLALAADAGPAHLFRPATDGRLGKNALTNAVARAAQHGDPLLPRLTAQRMRATWLVRHLDAGTPPAALLAAAGLDGLGSLDRYLRWTTPLAADQALALAGRSGA